MIEHRNENRVKVERKLIMQKTSNEFMNVLKKLGINPNIEKNEDNSETWTITVGDNPSVCGYAGFYVDFSFDANGEFLGMGIWE